MGPREWLNELFLMVVSQKTRESKISMNGCESKDSLESKISMETVQAIFEAIP